LKENSKESFINRKRPAVENLVQDFLGPAAQLDGVLSKGPPVPEDESKPEDNYDPKKNQ
jgi:hypothetical protein